MEGLLAFACIFFFSLNFIMFLTAFREYSDWKCFFIIAVIDFFYIVIVFVGIWAIATLSSHIPTVQAVCC